MAKATVKRATKKCNLFCNIDANRLEKRCCAFYCPRMKHVLQKSGCCKLREYSLLIGLNYAGVTPYTGALSLAAKQVCLWPVNRASCTEFAANSSTTLYFRNLGQAYFLQDRFD